MEIGPTCGWKKRATLAGAGALFLVAATSGCDSAKRELVDRVTPHHATTWTSRSDCQTLRKSEVSSSRAPRIGTWNIRYFPDSVEGPQTDPDKATDVAWLACAIASLDVDVLVVQEFKNSETALAKQQELIEELNALTGGDWQLQLDQCMPVDVQHPGFLYDATRATGEAFREIPSLNPDPECSNAVSPGFGGYFRIAGGPDFHLIAIHGSTGSSREQFEKRALITAALEAVTEDAYNVEPDQDIVFAGDFNSVGCEECDPVVSNEDEVNSLGQSVAGFEPALSLLPTTQACTRVADDMPHIDHVIAAASMAEIPAEAMVHVTGICEEIECDRQVEWLEDAYDHLSDHCPLVLDLAALDDD